MNISSKHTHLRNEYLYPKVYNEISIHMKHLYAKTAIHSIFYEDKLAKQKHP